MTEKHRFWLRNAFLLVMAVVATAMLFLGEESVEKPLGMALLTALLAMELIWFGTAVYRYVRRIRSLRREQTEAQWDESPENIGQSILYLRPFMVDHRKTTPMCCGSDVYASVEAVLCAALGKTGKPVAIGTPGEKLQPLGAKRIYATDDTWKEIVSSYLDKAQHVVLYADFTPGVLWEIEQAMARVRDKLILIPRVYNRRASLLRYPLMVSALILLYPVYRLAFNTLWIPRLRRGVRYYREWDRTLGKQLDGLKLNDRISAIIFRDGKPVPFYAQDGAIESQMDAIIQAVEARTAPVSCSAQVSEPGEEICFLGALAASSLADAALFPMGNVCLEPRGLRYRHSLLLMYLNVPFRVVLKYRTRRISYSAVRRIVRKGMNELMLQVDGVNKSLRLTVPFWATENIGDIETALYARGAGGRVREDGGAAEARLLEKMRRRNRIAGAIGTTLLLLGADIGYNFSLVLGVLLLIPAEVINALIRNRPLNWANAGILFWYLYLLLERIGAF